MGKTDSANLDADFDPESAALYRAALAGRIRGKRRRAKVLTETVLEYVDWKHTKEFFAPPGENSIDGLLELFRDKPYERLE